MSRFFGRQRGLGPGGQAGEPTIPVATVQGQDHGGRLGGVGHGHGAQKVGARGFSLMLWLRLHGVDLVTMALMGALGLGIYEAREFPPLFPSPNRHSSHSHCLLNICSPRTQSILPRLFHRRKRRLPSVRVPTEKGGRTDLACGFTGIPRSLGFLHVVSVEEEEYE